MGPVLVSRDQIENPNTLDIRCQLNGEILQDSNTGEMIFQIPFLIEFISRTCTLLPGDVISTGTPAGVGVFRDPQIFLNPGDVVEVEIEKIGKLRNKVV
jgi:2-keto-4-pentenoate hydratase/2-oxohepta-3-ene-1,7-dioic acid hydratase in catechol pathway